MSSVQALDGLSVADYIAQPRFNRSLTFLSAAAGKEVTASYSVSGSQATDATTFLYVGGLFGGRLHGLFPDYQLASSGVRGIFVDRPGTGLFTAVGIEQRIRVWFEAVPLILNEVGVRTVALVALSGGAPYAFNLLWDRPDLVTPDVPLYILSPWVHPSKSGVRIHAWMSYIPASMTRGLSKLATAALQRLLTIASNSDQGKKKLNWIGDESQVPETCGATAVQVQQYRGHYVEKILSEDMSGAAEDYILGVKDPKTTWGQCADYDDFARKVSERYQANGKTLRIQAFFAAKDAFIGEQGIQYFIDTFRNEELRPGIDFSSEVLQDTDHEGVAFPENGAVGKMIAAAQQ